MSFSKHFRRFLSVTLAVCMMLLVFSSCKDDDASGETDKSTASNEEEYLGLRLPYSREDGMNPFTAKTLMNNAIMPLVYSGLFSVDDSYNPLPDLAESSEVQDSTLVVSLGSKRFSDGSSVNADDVVYSFNKAKESVYYASSLTFFTDVTAANSNTVVFSMNFKNVYAAASLTFPIVKQGTAEDVTSLPVGAGHYTYSATTEGGILERNTQYSSDDYATNQVTLINMSSSQTLLYGLVINNYDGVFDDLSKGTSQRINASTVHVDLNNLIYIGLNANSAFSDLELRRYFSAVLDRERLINEGLEGYGVKTEFPFNPNWYGVKDVSLPKYNSEDAKSYLSSKLAGRNLNILVNSDNNFKVKMAETLKAQLLELGINSTVTSVPYATYTAGITGGYYDIYIGEYKLTNDMNISGLLSDEALLSSYAEMLAGNIKCSDFMTLFYDNQPFVPVAFRTGVLGYSRSVETEVKPLPHNPYANIYDWFI